MRLAVPVEVKTLADSVRKMYKFIQDQSTQTETLTGFRDTVLVERLQLAWSWQIRLRNFYCPTSVPRVLSRGVVSYRRG